MTTPIDIEAAEKRLREAMQQSPADFALDCFPVIRSLVAQLRDARAELGRLAEAVRVLGEECRAWREGNDACVYTCKCQDRARTLRASTDANPTTRAALSGGGRSLTPIEGTGG